MGRTILSIAGVILAIWLGLMVLGWIFSMLKFFFFVAIVAVIVVLAVKLIAKGSKS
ncbi:hypothetical protein [Actinomadura macrotermitis]|uniref:Uncharacterized protein n=1 Tax=Actinomadura macrotermitis TaxID=2585200 RepID=A0A7K0BVM7_9ACTN|nr:hypothetical protein [Actinomadura macrotermitis]MQY05229.1 hypothetical protein [Actinomadura macrotermitis]